MKQIRCAACGTDLSNTEIALNLKLRGKGIAGLFCLACMSAKLGCCREELEEMAAFFRSHGCELFQHHYVEEVTEH